MLPQKLISRKEYFSDNHTFTKDLHLGHNHFDLSDDFSEKLGYVIVLFDDKVPGYDKIYYYSWAVTNIIGGQIYGVKVDTFKTGVKTSDWYVVNTEKDFFNRLLSNKVPIIYNKQLMYQIVDSIITKVFL